MAPANRSHPPHGPHAPHPRAKWLKIRFWAVTIGLGLIAAVACLAGLAWWLIRGQPEWWRTLPPPDARAQTVGQDLENAVVNQLHAERPPADSWSVSLSAADANDWLNTRLVKWLASRDPDVQWQATVQQTMVDFRDGIIYIGAALRTDAAGASQVISASLVPAIDEKGQLWLVADRLAIGRMPLPLGLVSGEPDGLVMRLLPGDVRRTKAAHQIAEALAGREPLAKIPIATLADGRKVRLLGVIAREGRLEMTCRTESR